MKLLRSVITNYSQEFSNEDADAIISSFTDKQQQAFHIILHHASLPDDALNRKLASEIYGYEPSHRTYKSFKETFTRKMKNIVLVHQSKGSPIQRITYELIDECATISKLFALGLKEVAIGDIKKSFAKAMKYHKYEHARTLSLYKMKYYDVNGPIRDQILSREEFKNINSICAQESHIQNSYVDIYNAKEEGKDARLMYQNMIHMLNPKLPYDSCTFHYFHFSIQLLLADDDTYEDICLEAIDYFTRLHFNHEAYISIFKNRLLQHRISLGNYTQSKLVLRALIEDHREYSYHWYLYKLTYIQILLYSGDYQDAHNLYHKIINCRNFRDQKKDHRNEWHIIGMYVNIMADHLEDISIRKVKYNLNYDKVERSSKNRKYLIGELIYEIKNGQTDITRKINHLMTIAKDDARTVAFCRSISQSQKFNPKEKVNFDNEIVQYESLITKI